MAALNGDRGRSWRQLKMGLRVIPNIGSKREMLVPHAQQAKPTGGSSIFDALPLPTLPKVSKLVHAQQAAPHLHQNAH